jgi:hypothetical protein
MFNGCGSLSSVGAFDMSKISTLANIATFVSSCVSLASLPITGLSWTFTVGSAKLSATALDTIYTGLPTLNGYTVSNAVGSGTAIVFTTTTAHGFKVGQVATVTGIASPAGYNITSKSITAVTSTTFTVSDTTTGTISGTGTARVAGTITVTTNPGTAGDTPTIATNKGWTVTG